MGLIAKLMAVVGADTSQFDREMRQASHTVGTLQRDFVRAGAMMGGAALTMAAGVVKLGIEFNAMREQSQIAFTTILGSGDKATRMLDDLAKFAAKTPFEFASLTQQAQKLMAMGFESNEIVPMLTSIGDAVAAMGGSSSMIDSVTRAISQMQAKGKVQAQEMLQLAEAGIPAWKYLADTLNTDVAGAMELVTRGSVDAETAVAGLLKGMDKDFGGAMAAQSKTFQGVMSTIKDTSAMIAGDLTKPIFEVLRDEMVKFAEQDLPNWATTIETTISRLKKMGVENQANWDKTQIGAKYYEQLTGNKPGFAFAAAGGVEEWFKKEQSRIQKLINAEKGIKGGGGFGGDIIDPAAQAKIAKYEGQLEILEQALIDLGVVADETRAKLLFSAGFTSAPAWYSSMYGGATTTTPGWTKYGDTSFTANMRAETEHDSMRTAYAEQAVEDKKEAEERARKSAEAYADKYQSTMESRLSDILFSASEVTPGDMLATKVGEYEEKPDEYVRRLRSALQDPNSQWKSLIPEDVRAKGEDYTKWWGQEEISAYYKGQRPEKVNWGAVGQQYLDMVGEEESRKNLIAMAPEKIKEATGLDVTNEEMMKLFATPGEKAGMEFAEGLGEGIKNAEPAAKLLAVMSGDLANRSKEVQKAGGGFWTTFLDSFSEVDTEVWSSFVKGVTDGVMAELGRRNFVGGGALP